MLQVEIDELYHAIDADASSLIDSITPGSVIVTHFAHDFELDLNCP